MSKFWRERQAGGGLAGADEDGEEGEGGRIRVVGSAWGLLQQGFIYASSWPQQFASPPSPCPPPADERVHGVNPQWVVVDRIVSVKAADNGELEYLVKWKDLGYEQCRCGKV